ncbi:hypothetical protein N7465_005867 [Penicillium sp. CMV-2018d]|nr:hypothetical protein N7465_005867 [Penicillium sp. CMV-2018d]
MQTSLFCIRCGSSTPFAGLADDRRRVQSVRCPSCATAVRRGEAKWISADGEARHCPSCGSACPACSSSIRYIFRSSTVSPTASVRAFNGQCSSSYLRRNPRANTNTSPLFPVPAYRPIPKTKPNTSPIFPLPAYPPIPKTKTAGDPYNTRASDVSLPPDWDPGNTSAASRATLLKCSRESNFQCTHGGIRWLSSDQGAGGKKGRNRTVRYGGIEAVLEVFRGEAQLAIATPAQMMSTALTRQRIFAPHGAMP